MNGLKMSVIAVLLCSHAAFAQKNEVTAYQEEAGSSSILFSGKAAVSYVNKEFNGTYFWAEEDFHKGDVCFNGRVYYGILLNVDACYQDLLAQYDESSPAVVVRRESVPWFTIGDTRFVNLNLQGYDSMPEGYYEVLSEEPEYVVRRVNKLLQSSLNDMNGKPIGYEDPYYLPGVYDFFAYVPKYYLLRDGRFKKIGRHKAMKLSSE
ncbi:MAG: hypothetical protein Q4G10_04880 [Bacteroidia bacterium]|nr:hypothetical protein [Bacteroidia bacterium]